MRVALINGSPKINGSTSGLLLDDLKSILSDRAETAGIEVHTAAISEEELMQLDSSDVWVFACPLYVDGIPAHLLSCLVQLEKAHLQSRGILVYAIVNCGFYEGLQAEYALEILRNWCDKAGFVWSGGIGVGGGGALAMMPRTESGKGPRAPIDKALGMMADNMVQHKPQENQYVSVAFPRFLYKLCAQMGWRQMIRSNGGKTKDLGKQPESLME